MEFATTECNEGHSSILWTTVPRMLYCRGCSLDYLQYSLWLVICPGEQNHKPGFRWHTKWLSQTMVRFSTAQLSTAAERLRNSKAAMISSPKSSHVHTEPWVGFTGHANQVNREAPSRPFCPPQFSGSQVWWPNMLGTSTCMQSLTAVSYCD